MSPTSEIPVRIKVGCSVPSMSGEDVSTAQYLVSGASGKPGWTRSSKVFIFASVQAIGGNGDLGEQRRRGGFAGGVVVERPTEGVSDRVEFEFRIAARSASTRRGSLRS